MDDPEAGGVKAAVPSAREGAGVLPGGRVERAARRRRLPPRPTPFAMIVLAFVLLVAAAGTVAFAQLAASHLAPWISIGLSAATVAATLLALLNRRSS